MVLLNLLQGAVAIAVLAALPSARSWLPWRSMALSLSGLLLLAAVSAWTVAGSLGLWGGLTLAALAALAVMTASWWGSAELRSALAR